MTWVKKSTGGSKFLKFEAGGTHEGILKSCTEKPSPFKQGSMIWDYVLDMDGTETVLSSSSETLKAILPITPLGTRVKIDMIAKGGRKMYDVYIDG